MCSILGTTREVRNLGFVNRFQQRRGPDVTSVRTFGNLTLVHNLLSITGNLTPQPFIGEGVAALFNGEIYNYGEFGSFNSDGEALIPLYREYGIDFIRKLDGEFAIALADREKEILLLSTDVFGMKPLWVAVEGSDIGFASYASALTRLGFSRPVRVPPNTTRIYSLRTLAQVEERPVHTFDLTQYKETYDDFFRAFENSIRKRSRNLTKKIFLGLSSGHDSGAIACELERQGVTFKVFSISGGEDEELISERVKRHRTAEVFNLSVPAFIRAKHHLTTRAERVYMDIMPELKRGSYVSDNTGAVGLSEICRRARADDYKVLFSGQGADEIFSDYGFNGVKFTKHSSFGGKFPDDLASVFPWRNFFGGVQRAYLDKEEVVAGSYGVETRYPFLDTQVVQEFLALSPKLKNQWYKAPLHAYLAKNEYPFTPGKKLGFSPLPVKSSVKWNPLMLLARAYWWVRDAVRST